MGAQGYRSPYEKEQYKKIRWETEHENDLVYNFKITDDSKSLYSEYYNYGNPPNYKEVKLGFWYKGYKGSSNFDPSTSTLKFDSSTMTQDDFDSIYRALCEEGTWRYTLTGGNVSVSGY